MSNVIQMFRTCEITGEQVPNIKSEPEFFVIDSAGRGVATFKNYFDAVKYVLVEMDGIADIQEF